MTRFLAALFLLILAAPAQAFEITKITSKTTQKVVEMNEIASERLAQGKLPLAKDPMWDKLFQCKINFDNKTHKYSAIVTDDMKALNGKQVSITGFMYPLSFEEQQKEILISKRTPVCFFCPPGEPNELLDVHLADPIEMTSDLITIKGTFKLVNRQDEGIFFELDDAKLVK